MKRILVTGAGGFVGTHLLNALLAQNDNEVFAAVYKATSDISSLLPSDHIIEGDLTNYAFATDLINKSKPDIVYHLAALSVVKDSFANAVNIMNSNTTLSYNLFDNLRTVNPHCRIVAICSANVYGDVRDTSHPIDESTPLRPVNPYAVSKATQELLALQFHIAYGMDIVILRPFNHTGPGQTTDFVIPKLASQFVQIENGVLPPQIEIGNLTTVRDFTDVRDMVRAYILAAEHCQAGEIYNIGSGHGVSIAEIIEIFQSLCSTKVQVNVKAELVRSADVAILIANLDKFQKLTNYKPQIPLKQTISDILDSIRQIER